MAQTIALALALAFLTESMVEYLFGQIIDQVNLDKLRWLLTYVAAAVGVGLAFYYQLDLLALIGDSVPSSVGFLLSGLVIGRGANYLHGFVSTYLLRREY
ncbi:MAG: hypothetical protein UY48_C0001G0004 [Candidatus Gottesmanbacteria bacterium GW2011_GWB1_49_7]|uniref:Uncharacterized protein n=1 Tax=Candidatus Gottesmanbacteria bacterium GW2011_GWB1_49_7 TaxID=1618448 RepID=A0A0G1W3U7_9BACT|nr:MAG: hypothetical protein UY48_C0001G0004 [Candidatus Gottesmanbacteria bacterium GW2011_GWB1_49_7]